MRGLVFTEFLDFVERFASPDMVENMLEGCDLASGGAYTAVGAYDHNEILEILEFLSAETGHPVPHLLNQFGQGLFRQLALHFPKALKGDETLFDFLERLETLIQGEARKLYPESHLPVFRAHRKSKNLLILKYGSTRPFGDLAHGLISGAIAHFDSDATVTCERDNPPGGFGARFEIVLNR